MFLPVFNILILLFAFALMNGSALDTYIMCDFNLENINEILSYLPKKCQDIYAARESNRDIYDLYLSEAKQFANFFAKLEQYEQRNSIGMENEEGTCLMFDSEFRNKIYSQEDWSYCITSSNETDVTYLECVIKKREELVKLVPDILN